jgi:hypothetical protein
VVKPTEEPHCDRCTGCDGTGCVEVPGPHFLAGVTMGAGVVEVCDCGECNGTGHVLKNNQ